MKNPPEKTVQIRVRFSDPHLARPVLEDLDPERELAMNVLRGRVTPEEASFDLEVSGRARKVALFLRLSATLGANVGALPTGVT